MKTIIINGSPRKNGNTVSVIKYIYPLLKGEIRIINVYDINISPCVDCRYCYTHNKCTAEDDMKDIYDELLSADNIIIASPLYFSELTSGVLTLASRFQFFYTSMYVRKDISMIKEKKAAVILIGGGSSKTSEKALSTAKIILSSVNAKVVETLSYINTDNVPVLEDENVRIRLKETAEILSNNR